MRHAGEAEAAIAVGLDRRAAGIMRGADDDAGRRGPGMSPQALAGVVSVSAFSAVAAAGGG